MNPWYKKMVNRLTKNVRVDPQISFWRLKDFRKFNLSSVFQSDPNKSIGSIGGYPMMSEVDPR